MWLEPLLAATSRPIREPLERALAGIAPSPTAARPLLDATGLELLALGAVADELRRRQVGDDVTYVVNRNINFTNVCIKRCDFCAFSRGHRTDEGYFLPVDEVVKRALEARDLGATEVCLQAGLPPGLDGRYYIELCAALHRAAPELHIHAFSPEEVRYGATRARLSVHEYLLALREAGLGSLPGTSAEILDDRIREMISPGRISTADWTATVTAAHRIGLPTTATMMFGHIETPDDQIAHLDHLRSIQRETRGFTEIVPLSFVHVEAPMWSKRLQGLRAGPTGNEVLRVYAVTRIFLGADIPNVQVSWVKDGLKLAQVLLDHGANDLGGTLINESISTAAGASFGQRVAPKELRRAILDAGRHPAERTTLYGRCAPHSEHVLDSIDSDDARFGSYRELIKLDIHRYKRDTR